MNQDSIFDVKNEELLSSKTPSEPTTRITSSDEPYLNLDNTLSFAILTFFPISGALGLHNLILENGGARFLRHVVIDIIAIFFYFISFVPNLRSGYIISKGELIEALVILIAIASYIIAVIDGFRFVMNGATVPKKSDTTKKNSALQITFAIILAASAILVDSIAINIMFGNVHSRLPMYDSATAISCLCSIVAIIIFIKNIYALLPINRSLLGKAQIRLLAFNLMSASNILGLTFWILTFRFGLA